MGRGERRQQLTLVVEAALDTAQGRLSSGMIRAPPYLMRATRAQRYQARSFPWTNLARIWERVGSRLQALECYRKALAENPDHAAAQAALRRIQGSFNN